jgi:hypothetical protein
MAFLVAGLVTRFADGLAALFPTSLVARLANRVMAFLVTGLVARFAAVAFDGLVAGLVAVLVAGFAFIAVAGLANLLHDRLVHGLVAGVPALLQHSIVHQFVAGLALLLTGAETALGVTARLLTTGVRGGAAIGCGRGLDSPEQAGQRDKQRRSQTHPHDFCLLIGTGKGHSQRSEVRGQRSEVRNRATGLFLTSDL